MRYRLSSIITSFLLLSLLITSSFATDYVIDGDNLIMPMAAVSLTNWTSVVTTSYPDRNATETRYRNTSSQTKLASTVYANQSTYTQFGMRVAVPVNIPEGSSVTVKLTGFTMQYANASSSMYSSWYNSPWTASNTTFSGTTFPTCYIYDQNGEKIASFSTTASPTITFYVDHYISELAVGCEYGYYNSNTTTYYMRLWMTLSTFDVAFSSSLMGVLNSINTALSTSNTTLSTISSRLLTISNSLGTNIGSTVSAIGTAIGTYLPKLSDINTALSSINAQVASLLGFVTPIPDTLDSILSSLENISGGITSTPSQDQDAQDVVDRMDDITDEIDSMTDEIEQGTNRPSVSDILPSVNEDILNPTDQSASFAVSTVGGVLEVSFVQTLLIFVVSLCFIRYVIFGRS